MQSMPCHAMYVDEKYKFFTKSMFRRANLALGGIYFVNASVKEKDKPQVCDKAKFPDWIEKQSNGEAPARS